MTDKTQEALKLAREALSPWAGEDANHTEQYAAYHVIREALAEQPAHQEPYGQVTVVRRPGCVDQHWFYRWPEPPYLDNAAECHTVYTSPPASKPLTDEEIRLQWSEFWETECHPWAIEFARAIEAKLKEKNA